MVEACGNCRYFLAEGQLCRRHAPRSFLVGMSAPQVVGQAPVPIVNSYFPQTTPDHWCGEYAQGTGGSRPLPSAGDIRGALAGLETEGTA